MCVHGDRCVLSSAGCEQSRQKRPSHSPSNLDRVGRGGEKWVLEEPQEGAPLAEIPACPAAPSSLSRSWGSGSIRTRHRTLEHCAPLSSAAALQGGHGHCAEGGLGPGEMGGPEPGGLLQGKRLKQGWGITPGSVIFRLS